MRLGEAYILPTLFQGPLMMSSDPFLTPAGGRLFCFCLFGLSYFGLNFSEYFSISFVTSCMMIKVVSSSRNLFTTEGVWRCGKRSGLQGQVTLAWSYLGFETCSPNILVQSSYYSILNFLYLNIVFHDIYFRALFWRFKRIYIENLGKFWGQSQYSICQLVKQYITDWEADSNRQAIWIKRTALPPSCCVGLGLSSFLSVPQLCHLKMILHLNVVVIIKCLNICKTIRIPPLV